MQIKTLRYNAYSNRECIGSDDLSYYDEFVVDDIFGVNFIPGDGVNTELILNLPTAHSDIDYLLAVEDGLDIINSRWFVMDCTRLRNGQYKLSLYRDTLYDYKTEIANSTGFIKRGWITDINNPLLLNQEEFTTNQVVTSVSKLNQSDLASEGPWIVGYLARNADGDTVSTSLSIQNSERTLTDDEFRIFGGDPENPELNKKYCAISLLNPEAAGSHISYNAIKMISGDSYDHYGINYYWGSHIDILSDRADYDIFQLNTIVSNRVPETPGSWYYHSDIGQTSVQLGQHILNGLEASDKTLLRAAGLSKISQNIDSVYYDTPAGLPIISGAFPWGQVSSLSGRYVVYKGKRFKVVLSQNYEIPVSVEYKINITSVNQKIANLMNQKLGTYLIDNGPINPGDINAYHTISYFCQSVQLQPQDDEYVLDIPPALSRCAASKAPYDIFAFRADWDSNSSVTYRMAQAISENYKGSGALYDLQLVPYVDTLNLSKTTYVKQGTENIFPVYWLDVTRNQDGKGYLTFTNNPWLEWSPDSPPSSVDIKRLNQTKKVRVSSPNHSTVLEYNPAQCGRRPNTTIPAKDIQLKFTLKPYSPMFALKIPTNGTAGIRPNSEDIANWCVISGDFSLPQTSDAWETYQINNKNYLNAFNRQIESVELNNKYAKVHDVANAISGTVSAAVSAGTAGFAAGGPAGAAVGAVAGGVLSAAAGIADVGINEKLRTDQLDLQKDMFNYNLQNIQATPNTLNTVGAYDAMNYIFPYTVVYDCTDKEKAAFNNYLKYRGMSIGTIDTISAYKRSGHFIQADILKIDLHEDQHLINTIREEVSKGFFDGRVSNI